MQRGHSQSVGAIDGYAMSEEQFRHGPAGLRIAQGMHERCKPASEWHKTVWVTAGIQQKLSYIHPVMMDRFVEPVCRPAGVIGQYATDVIDVGGIAAGDREIIT